MDEYRFKVGQVVESHTINKRGNGVSFLKAFTFAAKQFNTSSLHLPCQPAEGLDHLKVHANQRVVVVHWGTN